MSAPDQTDSYAYILRLWRERPATAGQGAVWRISLTDTRSGERHGFGDLRATHLTGASHVSERKKP